MTRDQSLREEIAEQFNDCMGYWEGIKVPDREEGHRAIDYADQILKLIGKRIDSIYYRDIHAIVFYNKLKELLK